MLRMTSDICGCCCERSPLYTRNGAALACPDCDRPRCVECGRPYGPLLAEPTIGDELTAQRRSSELVVCEHCGMIANDPRKTRKTA